MKNFIKRTACVFALLAILLGCQDDNNDFGNLEAPSGLQVDYSIIGKDNGEHPNGDGSGLVDVVAVAKGAISYKFIFSDGITEISSSGMVQKRFTKTGVNSYTVTVLANGKGGVSSSITIDISDVLSTFSDPEAVERLTGGTSKTWYWAAAEPGHLGVGQNDNNAALNYFANYYQAAPFEKSGAPSSACLYESTFKFSKDGDQLKFEQSNNGHTFFNTAFESVVGGSAGTDNCYDYNTSGIKTVSLSPSNSVVAQNPNSIPTQTRGTLMTFSDGGFMGYYIGQSTYEILSITNTRMVVRAVMGGNPALAWYHTFSTSPPVQGGGDDYTNLVWSDDFNVDGAPDASKWTYDLGNNNGWGNSELQNYTNSASNVVVEGGNLKITAKAESLGGFNYTSARLKSEGKFDFKYGKVEFRAKLPTGGGTWPALWMLGSNYTTNPWPGCGEIDVMEHKGNVPNEILGTLHYPGRSGGNANSGSTTATNVSSEFHIYKVIWSPNTIRFFVDDTVFHTYANTADSPFNANFFLIMNVAMGGTFGGAVAPGFTQSSMEVDYVKVYQ